MISGVAACCGVSTYQIRVIACPSRPCESGDDQGEATSFIQFTSEQIMIRKATAADIESLTAIYNEVILEGGFTG